MLKQWAPFFPNRDLSSTGSVILQMVDGQKVEEIAGNVIRVIPPVVLEYTWGDDVLIWDVAPKETTGTQLSLRHSVEAPDWVPKVAAGWHICLAVAERLLDGNPIGPIVGPEAKKYGWDRLHDAYAEALGISGTGWPEETF